MQENLRPKVIYIGNDVGYLKDIRGRINKDFPDFKHEFIHLFEKNPHEFESLFVKIVQMCPIIIYLDLSTRLDVHIRLATMINREVTLKQTSLVGLVDNKETVRDCLSVGCDFIHVKCGETHDVVYEPMRLSLGDNKVKQLEFATATVEEKSDLIDDFRIGYITTDLLHVEGNLMLPKGELIEFLHDLPRSNVGSKQVLVKDMQTSNLYYDYKYSYDLGLQFVEPIEDEDDADLIPNSIQGAQRKALLNKIKERKAEQIREYEYKKKKAEKAHRDWVLDKISFSKSKNTKILIIDRHLGILQEKTGKHLDEYPFAIRLQTQFSDHLKEVGRICPQMITYQLYGGLDIEDREQWEPILTTLNSGGQVDLNDSNIASWKEEIQAAEATDLEVISRLIGFVNSIENYKPIIVLYGCQKWTKESLVKLFRYPLLIPHRDNVTINALISMATIFQNKQDQQQAGLFEKKLAILKKRNPKKFQHLSVSDLMPKNYYLAKNNPISFGAVKIPITIVGINETEIRFQSEHELRLRSFRMEFPVVMSVRLMEQDGRPYKAVQNKKEYFGLIHGVDEEDKMNLRRYINTIFFAPVAEKRAKEQEEYWERHKKLQEERGKVEEDSGSESADVEQRPDFEVSDEQEVEEREYNATEEKAADEEVPSKPNKTKKSFY